ncbi:MAG: hypothetical protein AB1778_02850 [Candidatus Bipolaricaulota bacterium]
MRYQGLSIDDTFCEVVDTYVARLTLTASTEALALAAAGFLAAVALAPGSALRGGLESPAPAASTPDGRPGMTLLFSGPTASGLDAFKVALLDRLDLAPLLLTCSLFDAGRAAPIEWVVDLAARLARWGDGHEIKETSGERELIRLPLSVSDQRLERRTRVVAGVDGALVAFGRSEAACLAGASEAAADVLRLAPGAAVLHAPGGATNVVKCGGATYKGEASTTHEAYCASLSGHVATSLPPEAVAAIEMTLLAISMDALREALRVSIDAFARTADIVGVSTPFAPVARGGRRIALRELLPAPRAERAKKGGTP